MDRHAYRRLVAVSFLGACVVLLAAHGSRAQSTGTAGPGNTAAAMANALAAAEATKAGNTPAPAGASIQINSPGQSDNCSLPVSAGYGSVVLGATVVWSHADAGCEHIRQAWALRGLGYDKAAVQMMCELKTVREAMSKAGTPCDAQH